jgi:hypothetical protein
MASSIEVGDDILAVLRANARSTGESESEVLRRLLLAGERVPRQRRRTRRNQGETVHALMIDGLVEPGDILIGMHEGRKLRAAVLDDGRLRTADGASYETPSSALAAAFGDDTDAWSRWHHVATGRTLAELRELSVV